MRSIKSECIYSLSISALLLAAPNSARAGNDDSLTIQCIEALPVWEEGLLYVSPEVSDFYLTNIGPQELSSVVNDKIPEINEPIQGGYMLVDENETVYKFQYEKARVKYSSKLRGFNPDVESPGNITLEEAENIALVALQNLGIGSVGVGTVFVNRVVIETMEVETEEIVEHWTPEVVVTVLRQEGDFPVTNSIAKVVINNYGQIARLQIVWPDFFVECCGYMRDYEEVASELASLVKLWRRSS